VFYDIVERKSFARIDRKTYDIRVCSKVPPPMLRFNGSLPLGNMDYAPILEVLVDIGWIDRMCPKVQRLKINGFSTLMHPRGTTDTSEI